MRLATSTQHVDDRPSLDVTTTQGADRLLSPAATIVGVVAVVASALYFLSDVIELVHGGFSTGQLWLTLLAEAAIPVFVLGLAFVQRPALARLGMISAFAYAYAYLYFTWTVVYALVNHTKDYDTLTHDLGTLMLAHGVVMVVAGVGFGVAVIRARVLPTWAAVSLIVGVVFVAAADGAPPAVQLVAAGIRDLGFAGLGIALLRRQRTARSVTAAAGRCGW